MYVCMYSFFLCTFTRASTNKWTVILHTHHGRKGNKLKRRRSREREARQNESEMLKKSKVGGKNNLKLYQASDRSNFV